MTPLFVFIPEKQSVDNALNALMFIRLLSPRFRKTNTIFIILCVVRYRLVVSILCPIYVIYRSMDIWSTWLLLFLHFMTDSWTICVNHHMNLVVKRPGKTIINCVLWYWRHGQNVCHILMWWSNRIVMNDLWRELISLSCYRQWRFTFFSSRLFLVTMSIDQWICNIYITEITKINAKICRTDVLNKSQIG